MNNYTSKLVLKRIGALAIMLLITSPLFAQQIVKGVVSNKSGTPLPGTSVIVKGTTKGTVTNSSFA